MLIPLGLADPKRVFSFAFESVGIPLLSLVGIGADGIQKAREMFAEHGLLVVLVGCMGLVPVPAKVMSMAAGGFGVPLLPFALVILVGRSARFYIVAAIIRFAGSKLVGWIERRLGRPLATLR